MENDEAETLDRTAELVSRDHILRRERGQGNINFPCSADHKQDCQPYPVDPYSYILFYILLVHSRVPRVHSRVPRVHRRFSLHSKVLVYNIAVTTVPLR